MQSPFDPSNISRFSVIRVPYQFQGEISKEKLFVVLGHRSRNAICIKATSKVDLYVNNPEMMAGCVFFKAREISCFSLDTAVQPDNQIPIAHRDIIAAHRDGSLEITLLPDSFEERLRKAITDSTTLDDRLRARLLELLDEEP